MNFQKIMRNTFIVTLWTLVYFICMRWFLVANWNFDILMGYHWRYLLNQWWYGGWVISGAYYSMLLLSIFLLFPLWLFGMSYFVSRNYKALVEKYFFDYVYAKKTQKIQSNDKRIRVAKKKSHKEIRPQPLSSTKNSMAKAATIQSTPYEKASVLEAAPNVGDADEKYRFSHRQLPDEFSEKLPFEVDNSEPLSDISFEETSVEPVVEDLEEIMQSAGASVVQNVVLNDVVVPFVAFSKDDIYLIGLDGEAGDWLADEERFSDEDPLWFSETSHRVSPICRLRQAQQVLCDKLMTVGVDASYHLILLKNAGCIINAEDMQETWAEMDVLVGRTDVGQPETLSTFEQLFPKDLEEISEEDFEKIKNVLV